MPAFQQASVLFATIERHGHHFCENSATVVFLQQISLQFCDDGCKIMVE
jgi:hypothetical protein